MRGILANQSVGIKLIALLALGLFGYVTFSAVGLVAMKGLYGIGAGDLAEMLDNVDRASGPVLRLVQGFITLGIFLFPALLGAHLFSADPGHFLAADRFPRPAWLHILWLTLLALGSGLLSDWLYRLGMQLDWPGALAGVEQRFRASEQMMHRQYRILLQMDSFASFLQVLTVMALLPALAEEALFRGVIQPLFQRGTGQHRGIFLTALAFAVLHQQISAFLPILALGLVLGYVRQWSGSLWAPSLMHFVNNAAIVVSAYFFDQAYLDEGTLAEESPWWSSLGLLLFFALLAAYALRQKKTPASAGEN